MIATCCKRREHYGRAIIFLVIIVVATSVITLEGKDKIPCSGIELHGLFHFRDIHDFPQSFAKDSKITP
jgi:hypothetical protein